MLDLIYLQDCRDYFDSKKFGFFDPIPKEEDILKFVDYLNKFTEDIDSISIFNWFTNNDIVITDDLKYFFRKEPNKIKSLEDMKLYDGIDCIDVHETYITYQSAIDFQKRFNRKISQICESIVELYFKRSYDNVKTLNTNRRVGILIKDLIDIYKKVNPNAETVDKSVQYVALTLQLYETFYGCQIAGISAKRPEKVKEEPNDNFYSLPRRRGRAMPRKED